MFLVIITIFEQLNSTKIITSLLNPVTTNAYIRGVCNQTKTHSIKEVRKKELKKVHVTKYIYSNCLGHNIGLQ